MGTTQKLDTLLSAEQDLLFRDLHTILPEGREHDLRPEHLDCLLRVCESYDMAGQGLVCRGSYYRYSGLTHTARVRNGCLFLRFSHHFYDQPDDTFEALAHIMVRKIFRMRARKRDLEICKRVERQLLDRIGEPISPPATRRTQAIHFRPPQGKVYALEEIGNRVSQRFFDGKRFTVPFFWSARKVKGYWGKYFAKPQRIVINSRLDSGKVPVFVLEAVVYHEMLHHVIGFETRGGRCHAHTPEFRRLEKRFPEIEKVEDFLKGFR